MKMALQFKQTSFLGEYQLDTNTKKDIVGRGEKNLS